MKKLLILLLTLVLSISAVGLIACGDEGDNGGDKPFSVTGTEGLSYQLLTRKETGEKYAILTGLKKDCTATEITVASHFNNYPVEEIGLVGPLSNMSKVEKINIHKLIKVVGDSAFQGANSLKEINFDSECVVDKIGAYAFANCSKLEKLNLPSTIKSMSDGVFDGCPLLTFNQYEGAGYLGSTEKPYMFLMKGIENATTCKVNKDCQVISSSAFEGLTSLTSITFESDDTLNNISASAFKGSGIESITIPSSVQSIGVEAFSECPNLTTVNISSTTKITAIGERAFYSCKKLEYVNNFEKCRLQVCNTAVFKKSTLKSIVIPNTVTEIKSGFLEDCFSLTSLTFEANSQLVRTEQSVFSGCTKLRQVVLPKSHTSCEWNTFYWCNKALKIFLERDSVPTGYNSPINKSVGYGEGGKVVSYDLELYLYRETRPSEEGNFWHYVDGGEVEIWP